MRVEEELFLAQKISEGDKEAFKELFDRYYKPLCVYAIKYIDDFDAAEDLVQSLFTSFWINFSKRKFEGSVRAYLFSSVRNNSIKLANQPKMSSLDQFDLAEEIEDVFEVIELPKEKINALYKEIEQLPPRCKEVFTAVIIENKRYKEAAEELGISVNTVKTQLSRGLKRLRGSLDSIIFLFLL